MPQRDWLPATSTSGRKSTTSLSSRQLLHPPPVSPPPSPRPLEAPHGVNCFSPSRLHTMFRPATRALARAPAVAARGPASTRLISTGPAPKSRSWKNYGVRLGLAAGAVYYYNTSSVFAQEPSCMSCLVPSGFRRTRSECLIRDIANSSIRYSLAPQQVPEGTPRRRLLGPDPRFDHPEDPARTGPPFAAEACAASLRG